MNFCLRHFACKCQGSSDCKERIILPPHDECRRMVLTQVGLPTRICVDIRTIVEHQFELDAIHPRLCQELELICPCAGIYPLWVGDATGMPLACDFEGQESLPQLAFM